MKAVISFTDGRRYEMDEVAGFHTSGFVVRVFSNENATGFGNIAESLAGDDIPFGVAYGSPPGDNPRYIAIKERKSL